MSTPQLPTLLTGTIRGKHLELDQETGLPEGQQVSVTVRPVKDKLPPGEGLRRAFGAWANDQDGLDEFLAEMRQSRDLDASHREVAP